ncbi:MAG: hypothetical protein ACYC3G_00780 [Minisyncoccota bacterium]
MRKLPALPATLKVGGHTYKLRMLSSEEILEAAGEICMGFTITGKSLIALNGDDFFSDSKLMECFLHELIEDVIGRFEIKMRHPDLTCLSEALFQMLRDNHVRFDQGPLQFWKKGRGK